MSFQELANSPILWAACAACVIWVLIQAAGFAKKSLDVYKKVGLTKDQVSSAVKASAFASVGPSVAVLAGMLALLVSMGGAISWFRLSYVGAVAYETQAAEIAAKATGSALGSLSGPAFVAAVWVMSICTEPYLLHTGILSGKMDKIQYLFAGKKAELLPIVGMCGACGIYAYLCMDRVMRMNQQTVAAVAGFIIMTAFCIYNKKANKKWIRNWAFTISMFAGMLISVIV